MTISRDAVTWAYRMILGREPESEEVIERLSAMPSVAQLRSAFLDSPEFRGRPRAPLVGGHNDVKTVQTEVSGTDEEMRQMLANIAREWREFGKTEPHWSVLTSENFKAENLPDNVESFYESGLQHLDWMLNPLSRSGVQSERFAKVLDFGCGVGRLTLALATVADQAIGVDISPAHIALARDRAAHQGVANVDFMAIDAVEDLDSLSDFDLVISFIVLQHNPPPIMAAVLRKLLAALKPGGAAIIQLPTFIKGQTFRVQDYLKSKQPAMEMNGLPQHIVFDIVDNADCRLLEVRQDLFMGGDIGLSHTFAIQKRERPA